MKSNWILVGCLMLTIFPNEGVWATAGDPTEVSFRWENWEESDRAFLEEQRATLKGKGAKVGQIEEIVPSVRNPIVVWLVLGGIATFTMVAERIVDVVKKLNQCGLVVDGKGEELKLRRNCDLDQGQILALNKDGTIDGIEFEGKSSSDLISLVETMLKKAVNTK